MRLYRIGIVSLISVEGVCALRANVDHPRSRVAHAEGQFSPERYSILISDSRPRTVAEPEASPNPQTRERAR
jgi:hypothetical protein